MCYLIVLDANGMDVIQNQSITVPLYQLVDGRAIN